MKLNQIVNVCTFQFQTFFYHEFNEIISNNCMTCVKKISCINKISANLKMILFEIKSGNAVFYLNWIHFCSSEGFYSKKNPQRTNYVIKMKKLFGVLILCRNFMQCDENAYNCFHFFKLFIWPTDVGLLLNDVIKKKSFEYSIFSMQKKMKEISLKKKDRNKLGRS